ncbi:MAG TPA: GntR family transcriptional regulator [Plantibacter sp.]|uniref:GntR family transcriptional regulator n=1 Tax=unclassified Plantibacter TaxID=2624265 RepID=UPI002C8CBC67|nr:GntR family transcriptional regulator [Plantibacter sp.]
MTSDQAPQPPVTDRRLLRQNVFERLLADIIDGTLAPGRRLRDDELTVMLGVSRTPLREAVARLDELGLVNTAPNRYTRVAPLASTAIFEAVDVLIALAPLVTNRLTERLDEDALLEVDFLTRRIERLPADQVARAIGILLRFAERSLDDLALLPSLTSSTMVRLIRYTAQRPGVLLVAGGLQPVMEITQALQSHDVELTTRLVVAHLERIGQAVRADWNPEDLGYPSDNDESPR